MVVRLNAKGIVVAADIFDVHNKTFKRIFNVFSIFLMIFFAYRMDKDGTLQIDWDEWREFHFLNPNAHNMVDIIKFWKHSTVG